MNNFNILNLSLSITKKNALNTPINFLIKLNDGRLLSSSDNENIIKIYNLISFNEEIIIIEEENIIYINQISNKILLVCMEYKLKLYLINNNNYNLIQKINDSNGFNKIIELKNKNLLSSSKSGYLNIWQKNEKNLYEKIYSIIEDKIKIRYSEKYLYSNNANISDILELKKNIIISENYLNFINIWNIENKQKIISMNIQHLCGGWTKERFLLLNDKYFIYYNRTNLYLYDINTYKIIFHLIFDIQCVYIYNLNNNNLLIGNENGFLNHFKLNGEKIELINFIQYAHFIDISAIVKLSDNLIASGDNYGNIKIWKYQE